VLDIDHRWWILATCEAKKAFLEIALKLGESTTDVCSVTTKFVVV
jgi:hypothetical protein